VIAQAHAASTRFAADQLHAAIGQQRMKQPNRVAASTDTGDRRIGQAAMRRQHLLAHLAPNHALQRAHQPWIGVRPDG
jgi:hypothetical protein